MPDILGCGVHYASDLCQSKAEVEAERSQEPWDSLYSNPQEEDKLFGAPSRVG